MAAVRLSTAWNLMASERVTSRIAVSFIANLTRAAVSFLTGLIIARFLGPAGYGDLNYLLASTLSISTLFECCTSTAFFTGIARRHRSGRYFKIYGAWHATQVLLPMVMLWLAAPNALMRTMWPDQDRERVMLAFAASFLVNQTWGLLSQLAESRRKTFLAQTATISQVLGHLVAVVVISALGLLSINHILILLIVEYIVLTIVLAPYLLRLSLDIELDEQWRTIVHEFITYCRPLVLVSALGVAYSFADRWMLQRFGGSIEQGIFSVAQQFSVIGLMLTSSLVRVFWKEIAEARERNDRERIDRLYRKVTRTLYFAVCWLCCLFIPYTYEVLIWTLGARFAGGWICLLLMFIYPVHQALSQVQATVFFASGDTRVYSRIGIMTVFISVPVAYLLLAPRTGGLPGLGLGSNGLALKLVLMQWLSVSLQSKAIANRHSGHTDYAFEIGTLGTLFAGAWLCRWLTVLITSILGVTTLPIRVAAGCLLYAIVTAAVLYLSGARRLLTPRAAVAVS
jgi:O-antigen/teichoic acid export membrane protein